MEAGREKLDRLRPLAERHSLTLLQLACAWNLAHPAVECVAPTLIEEAGSAKSIELKREELAGVPAVSPLSAEEVETIRAIGDNTGSMLLKGATPDHDGEEAPDRWAVGPEQAAVAQRWGIDAGERPADGRPGLAASPGPARKHSRGPGARAPGCHLRLLKQVRAALQLLGVLGARLVETVRVLAELVGVGRGRPRARVALFGPWLLARAAARAERADRAPQRAGQLDSGREWVGASISWLPLTLCSSTENVIEPPLRPPSPAWLASGMSNSILPETLRIRLSCLPE